MRHERKCHQNWALKEGHYIPVYKLWKYQSFPLSSSIANISTCSCQSTIMSSITPPQWTENDGSHPHLVLAHDVAISRLVYLPDGRRVVTSYRDGTVKVWNVESGEQEGSSLKHGTGILADLAVTRDGMKIIGSDFGGKVRVWDVGSHEVIKEWTHPERRPRIAILPDDRLIAVGAWTVAIYTMEGRQVSHSIEVARAIWSVSFSPDGTKLACVTNGDIHVYDDVDTGTLILGTLKGGWVYDMLWSRDSSRLFSGAAGMTIYCWNTDTGEQIGHPWTGHKSIHSLSLSPDGSILASASWDKTVHFWDSATGNPIGQHLLHDGRVHTVHFFPSGQFVASAGSDGKLYL